MRDIIKQLLDSHGPLIKICESVELSEQESEDLEYSKILIAEHGNNLFQTQLHEVIEEGKKKRYNQKYDFANMKVGEFIIGNKRIDGAFNSWERRNKSGFKMRIGKEGVLWRIA